ncbi:MAG: hypothetical protein NTW94_03665 [Legionellales bacterium]|nr:hypothetical protein [Legionellales bacterium]
MNTVYLATVLGWYMVVFGLLLSVKHVETKAAMEDVLAHRGQYFMLAIMTLLLGLLLVVSHNLWIMAWPVVVTVFAWLVLLGGVFRLFFPAASIKMGQDFLRHPMKMKVMGVVFLLVGIFLLYHVLHLRHLTTVIF